MVALQNVTNVPRIQTEYMRERIQKMKKRMGDFFRGNTRQLIQICFFVAACILSWLLDFNRLFDSWYTNTDASPDNWLWHLALFYGNPAISILLVGLARAAVRKWNSEYVMNKNGSSCIIVGRK